MSIPLLSSNLQSDERRADERRADERQVTLHQAAPEERLPMLRFFQSDSVSVGVPSTIPQNEINEYVMQLLHAQQQIRESATQFTSSMHVPIDSSALHSLSLSPIPEEEPISHHYPPIPKTDWLPFTYNQSVQVLTANGKWSYGKMVALDHNTPDENGQMPPLDASDSDIQHIMVEFNQWHSPVSVHRSFIFPDYLLNL